VDGPVSCDTKVAPPPADEPREDYASLPFDNAKGTADQQRDILSSLPYGG
jgi:hypothetical protein